MKVVFFFFFGIAYIFSKEILENSNLLKSEINKSPQTNNIHSKLFERISRSFLSKITLTTNDKYIYILALILEKNHSNSESCRRILEEKCKELNNSISELNNICNDINSLCQSKAYSLILSEVQKLSNRIISFLRKDLPNEECTKLETECFFLENVSLDSIFKLCNEIRQFCYMIGRQNVADYILLKALYGFLDTYDSCKSKIEEICLLLSVESDELLYKCLLKETTCMDLVNINKNKCIPLKRKIETTNDRKTLKADCLQLFYECGMHSPNCKDVGPTVNSQELYLENKESCSSLSITDIPNHNRFPLTEQGVFFKETLGLSNIYAYARLYGINISKRTTALNISYFLQLLSQDFLSQDPLPGNLEDSYALKTKCEKILRNNCSSFTYLFYEFNLECQKVNNNKISETCKELGKKMKENCHNLKETLMNKVFNYNISIMHYAAISYISWKQLQHDALTDQQCSNLQSECFYLERSCYHVLYFLCSNLRSLCYKKSRDAVAITVLSDTLGESLYKILNNKLNNNLLDHCIDLLLKKYQNINKNKDLIRKILYPKETCIKLIKDFKNKCLTTKNNLEKSTMSFLIASKVNVCETLGLQCKQLTQDCYIILKNSCDAFHKRCNLIKESNELIHYMLKIKNNPLKDEDICKKKLKELCLSRNLNDKLTTNICNNKAWACRIMVMYTYNHCLHFGNNLEKCKILLLSNEDKITKDECTIWETYCIMLRGNCPSILDKKCSTLRNSCSRFSQISEPTSVSMSTQSSSSSISDSKPTSVPTTLESSSTSVLDLEPTASESSTSVLDLEPTASESSTSASDLEPTLDSKSTSSMISKPTTTTRSKDDDKVIGNHGTRLNGFQKKLFCFIIFVIIRILPII
ncbi:uncharacterized protein T551_03254 [Pneumocystis jirovecii RU7]|uniref:Major surface glycoprotein 2 C-terminal domain-containing protein n=1 Tax=Pneumocystis jirovecii (strain RU7) TaxID=1408657 RepID=A0A0W4ZFU6_PNEJ7|nr:uncharacterized protein T551_03254 [Pneumocystis jirovecii RU7]KTW27260.1 hypothetical protein T551_03254 [Pneumocystis jirovecii RU7]